MKQKQTPSFTPFCLVLISFLLVLPILPVVTTDAEAEVGAEYFNSSPGRYNAIQAKDIDKDGNIEIIFGDYDGILTILEFDRGTKDFFYEAEIDVGSNRVWGVEIGDVTGDEKDDIVCGNGMGKIFVFEVEGHGEYKESWVYQGTGRDAHGLLLHDFTGDGVKDIAVGTQYKNDDPNGMFYIVEYGKDKEIFKTQKSDSRWRGIDIGDPDMDGEEEVVVGCGAALGDVAGEGYLRVYNVTLENHDDPLAAEPEWESEDLGGCVQGVGIEDIDGDGKPEIVCSNGYRYRDGWIQIFEYDESDGKYDRTWKSENVGPKPFGFLLEDVDDDSRFEIIVGNQPGYIYIYDAFDRKLEWKSDLLGTDVMGFCTVDLDEDPQLEIIAAQGGYQGKGDFTSAYTTPHIYVIDGKTHKIEYTLGDKDYLEFTYQVVLLVLVILFLLEVSILTKLLKTKYRPKKLRRKEELPPPADDDRSKDGATADEEKPAAAMQAAQPQPPPPPPPQEGGTP